MYSTNSRHSGRRSIAPAFCSPFWLFITRGGRPRSRPLHVDGLSEHLSQDIGIAPSEDPIHYARYL